jgi:hypothetical protein
MAKAATAQKHASNDVTPERRAHVTLAGLRIFKEPILTEDGKDTGDKRRKIEHPLYSAFRKNLITKEMYDAACKLMELMAGARSETRTTSSHLPAVDNSSHGDDSNLHREYCKRAYVQAKASINSRERDRFISWLEDCEVMDKSIAELGEWFTVRKHRQATAELGIYVLCNVLGDLVKHFGCGQRNCQKTG